MVEAASERVELSIDGMLYAGWTGVSIIRAIDTMSGEFTLSLTDRERIGADRLDIRAGLACKVKVGGETLITGWIDRISPQIDANSHSIEVAGRDKAADLIDCSAIAKPGLWKNVSIEAIAEQLAKPFGVSVTAKASTAPSLRRFALQQGETVQAAIERLCRFRGLLAISTPEGNIELITPAQGATVATISDRDRAISLSATHDVAERFSEYVILGQSSGSNEINGRAAASPRGSAKDPSVKRYRPLVIVAEEQGDAASLEKRAKWEATTRAGRAQEATITVPGWRVPGDGRLWAPNLRVQLDAPAIYMQGEMLVTSAALTRDESGTTTVLKLSPPEAWSQLAIPEQADASAVGKKK